MPFRSEAAVPRPAVIDQPKMKSLQSQRDAIS